MPTEMLSEQSLAEHDRVGRSGTEKDGLSLVHVSKRFESVQALADLSFSVEPGRMLGFLGPNRAGKTTAMRAVFGLVQIDGGEVLWCGRPVRLQERLGSATCRRARPVSADARARAARVLQPAARAGQTRARRRLQRWLERLGLAERGEAKVEELSHGNQQRAQLAAALVHEPKLLVLDEPFAGLDALAVRTLAEVLRGEAARGAAVVFSSHQLELVEDICEDVVIIDHGRIVATGTVDALRRGSGGGASGSARGRIGAGCPPWRASSSSSAVTAPIGCSPTAMSTRNRCSWRHSVSPGRRLQLRPALARGALLGADRVMSARGAIYSSPGARSGASARSRLSPGRP